MSDSTRRAEIICAGLQSPGSSAPSTQFHPLSISELSLNSFFLSVSYFPSFCLYLSCLLSSFFLALSLSVFFFLSVRLACFSFFVCLSLTFHLSFFYLCLSCLFFSFCFCLCLSFWLTVLPDQYFYTTPAIEYK